VAIVGSREASEEGLALARKLGEGLASAGVEVVSGGARGVDAAAHAGALWGEGTTVAVLGCGIDVVYPRENAALFDRIAGGGGAIVSEFPPGTFSAKSNFPRRNRTLSGLSSAVVVVRAAAGSGALITAAYAAEQGRPVFAMPGDPEDPLCAGPNGLIEAGAARAVSSAAAVLRHLGWPVPERLDAPALESVPAGRGTLNRPAAAGHRRPSDGEEDSLPGGPPLDEVGARLWNLLDERRPLHLDELAGRGNIGAQDALRSLQELELKGLCVQRPGKYYLRRTP
jgi:DNA processing protein